jgi:hypothetical protein
MRQAEHHTPDVQSRTNRKTQVGQKQFTQVLGIEAKAFFFARSHQFPATF